jgi:DNA-binding GntR family transcriptional regulator
LRSLQAERLIEMIPNRGPSVPVLEEVHRGLVARISFFRGRSMSLEGRARSSLAEMRDIFESIAAGDEKAARKASRRHVLKAKAAAKISMDSGV